MTTKLDLRSVACEIAKKLAAENGGKPNQYMKEAWAQARAQKEAPAPAAKPISFFSVEYKTMKGWAKAIVYALTKEEAMLKFNNPAEPFGPRAEIGKVTAVKKAPAGYQVTVNNSEGIPVVGKIEKELPLDGSVRYFELNIRGKVHTFPVIDIVSIVKPPKEHVMKGGRFF